MKFAISSIAIATLLISGVLAIQSCKKDKDPNDKGPACSISNADLTYNKNMKSLIDRTCLSCHSGAGPGPRDYRTYEGLKPVLDDGDLLGSVVIDKDMPQSGITMSQAQRDSVNCWIKAGYPQ